MGALQSGASAARCVQPARRSRAKPAAAMLRRRAHSRSLILAAGAGGGGFRHVPRHRVRLLLAALRQKHGGSLRRGLRRRRVHRVANATAAAGRRLAALLSWVSWCERGNARQDLSRAWHRTRGRRHAGRAGRQAVQAGGRVGTLGGHAAVLAAAQAALPAGLGF